MICIKNLTKRYGKENAADSVVALNDINLEIEEGEFIGIVGESGSGKSTLLNIIGALEKPTKGSVTINDTIISSLNENEAANFRRDNVGFIFQEFFLDVNLNVMQNIEIPMILKGIDKKNRQEKIISLLQELGLEDKLNSKIFELSGGQKQKVCIARALVNNPKIILADEPTGNLDKKNGEKIIDILKQFSQKGFTVILVTHNMHESQACDRLIRLEDGKVIDCV